MLKTLRKQAKKADGYFLPLQIIECYDGRTIKALIKKGALGFSPYREGVKITDAGIAML